MSYTNRERLKNKANFINEKLLSSFWLKYYIFFIQTVGLKCLHVVNNDNVHEQNLILKTF